MKWFRKKKQPRHSTGAFSRKGEVMKMTDRQVAFDPEVNFIGPGDDGYEMLMEVLNSGNVYTGTRNEDGTWDVTNHGKP